MTGVPLPASDSEAFGHTFPVAPNPHCSIITFQNIGPQPKSGFNGRVAHNSRSFQNSKASIALFAEHCLNEQHLDLLDTFNYRMRRADRGSFSYLVNNINDVSAWNQTGGTGFTLNKTFKSHKIDHGCDPTGLGRWTHARFRGKANASITVFSPYRPCRSLECLGSVWNQHCRYYRDQCDISQPNPQLLFDADLLAAISTRLEAGDGVILGVDNNDDVRTSALCQGLKALGLCDAILSLHSPA